MSSEFTIKIISRLRARKPAAHLIPFDFFAADGVFGGTVGDDAAAEFFAQGVHCGFDGFLLFLLCVVRAEQVELARRADEADTLRTATFVILVVGGGIAVAIGIATSLTLSRNRQMVDDIASEDFVTAYSSPSSSGTTYMMYGYKKGYTLKFVKDLPLPKN